MPFEGRVPRCGTRFYDLPRRFSVVAEQERGTQFGGVVGAITFGVVQCGDIYSAGAGGRGG
jgi:hypothetical protein